MRRAARILPYACAVLAGLCAPPPAPADALARRLDYGWALEPAEEAGTGARVVHVVPSGPAERAGVHVGDRVIEVNGAAVATGAAVAALRFSGPPGQPQTVVVRRGLDRLAVQVEPREAARETHPGLETEWGSVEGPRGLLLRTIVTRPKRAGPAPAIFVVGWLSCDSVEIPAAHPDPIARLLGDLAERSGGALVRVDKPGCGDSEGVCASTDFQTELDGYRRAFAATRADPRIDASRIVVVGISNGGGFAPLVAGGAPVAGYVTIGGWSKTWFEHMLDLERRRLALSGTPPERLDAMMAQLAEFHAAYLFDGLTPGEVVRTRPHLAGIWYDAPDSQYGRPARFYHQLQHLDLAAAWSRVRAPTLVVWGEYDWIMDRADQEQLVRLVNAGTAGAASLLVVPRADHGFATHADRQAAFDHMGEGAYPSDAADRILRFVRDVLKPD